jgi:HSP20 family protein
VSNVWNPLGEFQRHVHRMLQGMESGLLGREHRPFPALNLYETADAFVLVVDVPGLRAEDLEVSLAGDAVLLRGERRRLEPIDDESFRRQERPFGRWSRSISLPDRVDADRVTADCRDGRLRIRLPRSLDGQPRTIVVGSGRAEPAPEVGAP